MVGDFLWFEDDKEAMEVFYNLYVRAVVTTKVYQDRINLRALKPRMQLSTISDDAYALVVLENNEKVWIDKWSKEEGGGDDASKEGDENETSVSETQYTDGSRGWTNEGK